MKQQFIQDDFDKQQDGYQLTVDNFRPTAQPTQKEPEKKWNDIWASLLFVGHFGLIGYLAFSLGLPEIDGTASEGAATPDFSPPAVTPVSEFAGEMIGGMCMAMGLGIGLSLVYVKVCITLGKDLIHVSTKFFIALMALLTVVNLAMGNVVGGIICLIILAINCCWYKMVYNRIAFAGANLGVTCECLKNYPTLFVAAFAALVFNFVWVTLWCMAMIGVVKPSEVAIVDTNIGSFDSSLCFSYDDYYMEDGSETPNPVCESKLGCCSCDDSAGNSIAMTDGTCPSVGMGGGTYFLMLISLYWGSTVIANVMHCVTAGTVATWWFQSSASATPVFDSFFRAVTYSFGSICFGSLLVAILKAIRQMLREAEKNKNAQIFMCIIQCILGVIESLLEIFNRYAFCYVSIYGYDFMTAGRSVFALFKKMGWTTIINDDLIENALSFGCVGVGLVCGLASYLYAVAASLDSGLQVTMSVVGIFIGFFMSSVTLNVVSSGVATVFVCFAENPGALQQNFPQQSALLTGAWSEFHGDVFNNRARVGEV